MSVSKTKLARLSQHDIAALDLIGVWINELGSTMNIDHFNQGTFSGEYRSKDGQGQWVVGQLQGSVAGDTIGFTVSWLPTYASVTSWAGKLAVDEIGAIHIHTLWLLASGNAALPLWQSISAGADVFWKPN